jgi:uncharacterized protein
MANPVVHFEILTKNAERARDFYAKAFGWNIKGPLPGAGPDVRYFLVEREGEGIAGGIGSTPDGYDGHVTFYIGVANLEQALADVEKLGGSKLMGPEQVPNGPRVALVRDPESNVIGLVQSA